MPKPRKPQKPPQHDAAYKALFSRPETVADTLRAAARDLARRLDFSTLERLSASFVTGMLGKRHADMLWRVRTRDGEWLYLLVLLEFQSTVERRMALRMADYALRILRSLEPKDLGPGGELPPLLPVVVYNGERRWTAPTELRDLFAAAPRELLGYLPLHRYLLIDLRRRDPEEEAPKNVLALIAKLERAGSAKQLEERLESAAAWIEERRDRRLAAHLVAWVNLVLAPRVDAEGEEAEFRITEKEEGQMTTLVERMRLWGDELNREWLEKGREQGHEKGFAKGLEQGLGQGLEQGLELGRLDGERAMVLRMVTRRFGAEAAEDLAPVLARISDPECLAAIAARVLECGAAEELVEWARGA